MDWWPYLGSEAMVAISDPSCSTGSIPTSLEADLAATDQRLSKELTLWRRFSEVSDRMDGPSEGSPGQSVRVGSPRDDDGRESAANDGSGNSKFLTGSVCAATLPSSRRKSRRYNTRPTFL